MKKVNASRVGRPAAQSKTIRVLKDGRIRISLDLCNGVEAFDISVSPHTWLFKKGVGFKVYRIKEGWSRFISARVAFAAADIDAADVAGEYSVLVADGGFIASFKNRKAV